MANSNMLKRSGSPLFEPESGSDLTKRMRTDVTNDKINYNGRPLIAYNDSQSFRYEDHEELPRLPSNHSSFRSVERLNASIIQKLRAAIQKAHGDHEIKRIGDQLEEKKLVDYGTKKMVGVVGDTGTGKSTFINALLGKEALANTVRGSYCTFLLTF